MERIVLIAHSCQFGVYQLPTVDEQTHASHHHVKIVCRSEIQIFMQKRFLKHLFIRWGKAIYDGNVVDVYKIPSFLLLFFIGIYICVKL